MEALRDLVKRDNQQDVPGLAYVEFDVHVRPRRRSTDARSPLCVQRKVECTLTDAIHLVAGAGELAHIEICCHYDARSEHCGR